MTILGRAELGPYRHLTLAWPEDGPPPAPGQHLHLADGDILWPMREAQGGRLEVLAHHTTAPCPDDPVMLQGVPLIPPQGEAILVAQGLGLAPLIHLCERLRGAHPKRLLAVYEPPRPAPFRPRPSRFLIDGMPAGVIAAIPLLEDWGIPSRLASIDGLPGAFEGGAEALLAALPFTEQTTVFAFGDAHFLARMRPYGAHLGHALRTS